MKIEIFHFLFLSAALFSIGFYAAIRRRNLILVLIGIELMVNAAVINLVAFSNLYPNNADGKMMALFAIVLSAASIGLALAIVVKVYQYFKNINPDKIEEFKN